MTYTGHVTPGGPAAVHELPRLVITKVSVGPMDNNAYLLRCRQTDEQVLIDAANEADRLVSLVGEDGLGAIVTTHQHADHWQALAAVRADTGGAHVCPRTGRRRHPGRDRRVPRGRRRAPVRRL